MAHGEIVARQRGSQAAMVMRDYLLRRKSNREMDPVRLNWALEQTRMTRRERHGRLEIRAEGSLGGSRKAALFLSHQETCGWRARGAHHDQRICHPCNDRHAISRHGR